MLPLKVKSEVHVAYGSIVKENVFDLKEEKEKEL